MLSSSLSTKGTTTTAGRFFSSHAKLHGNMSAPCKVNSLFTTKKAKAELTRLQASNNDDPNPPSTSSSLLSVDMFEKQGFRLGAFTKANELFIGRMAMLGVASSVLGELLTGKGALGQLGLETGLPVFELDWTILVVVGFNLVAALWPTKDDDDSLGRSGSKNKIENTTANEESSGARGSESTNGYSSADFAKFFSVKSLFSKDREILIGRVAQLGFAASLLGEGLTGKGILAQFNIETGITVSDLKIFLVVFVVLTLVGSVWENKEEEEIEAKR